MKFGSCAWYCFLGTVHSHRHTRTHTHTDYFIIGIDKHDYYLFLPPDVAEAIFLIYTDLSVKKLLERSVCWWFYAKQQ